MAKKERIEIRVSKEEQEYYKSCADRYNMSLSDWARNRLNENRSYAEYAPVLAGIITRMQTDINKAQSNIDFDESMNSLWRGVEELWRFLRK